MDLRMHIFQDNSAAFLCCLFVVPSFEDLGRTTKKFLFLRKVLNKISKWGIYNGKLQSTNHATIYRLFRSRP